MSYSTKYDPFKDENLTENDAGFQDCKEVQYATMNNIPPLEESPLGYINLYTFKKWDELKKSKPGTLNGKKIKKPSWLSIDRANRKKKSNEHHNDSSDKGKDKVD